MTVTECPACISPSCRGPSAAPAPRYPPVWLVSASSSEASARLSLCHVCSCARSLSPLPEGSALLCPGGIGGGAFTTVSSVPEQRPAHGVLRGAPFQPGRRAGDAVPPRTAPHGCGGQWSWPAFQRGPSDGQRVPGTLSSPGQFGTLVSKEVDSCPVHGMVWMLTQEGSRGGLEGLGCDPAGRGGSTALPQTPTPAGCKPSRIRCQAGWDPHACSACAHQAIGPRDRVCTAGFHSRRGEIGVQLRGTRAAPLMS